jgi:DNA-binding transcriptional LysR family regulator
MGCRLRPAQRAAQAVSPPAASDGIAALDLRQLRTLHLLLTTLSVSRTARELGVSQPAASAALARLRRGFADPLLVRAGAGFVRTERAEALLAPLEALLSGYEALTAPEAFEPARATRRFRIASPNYLSALIFPALAERIVRAAPGLRIEALTVLPYEDYTRALAEGGIDLLIGNWDELPSPLRAVHLLEDRTVCLMAPDHPAAAERGEIGMGAYLALDHISPSTAQDARFSPIDGRLGHLGLRRRIRMVMPDYLLIPRVVARTGLVLTTGAAFVPLTRAAGALIVRPAPAALSPIRFRLIWHERRHADAGHRWMRGLLREVMEGLTP